MPEGRLQRTRDAYRNGLAFLAPRNVTPEMIEEELGAWRAWHENAAEQLKRRGITANVIEGDQH
jgi:hypothetical protein